jgi:hypothetical protein
VHNASHKFGRAQSVFGERRGGHHGVSLLVMLAYCVQGYDHAGSDRVPTSSRREDGCGHGRSAG